MIRFETPWLLLALLLLPALALWRWRRPGTQPAAVLWGTLAGFGRPGAMAWLVLGVRLLPWIALALALLAAARPQRGMQQSEVDSRGVDIVLAMDVSQSMVIERMGLRSRMDVALETARDFVRGRPHDRLGVVGFSGVAYTLCPLTLDHATLLELLAGIDGRQPTDGTAIGMGLATAVQRLRDSRSPSKVIVLLTDGENNRGAIDPRTAAELARAMGVKVYTVLVGQQASVIGAGGDVVAPLVEIAERTGGRFYSAGDAAALGGIYAAIDRLERAPIRAVVYHEYQDLGPALLAIASVLMALFSLSNATWAFRAP
ncbi:MAG: VWA domain-containing protein [Candidatus Eisenbacteria bacterium]|uniref:VWA domain-containing protein n=1 Tax=Eiseniibacteriota bacterium TaxID=2212470 RepID=A0A933SBT9_UNCEI|nr:VWA domain-containing protein [Candidatus Eisenbacteria bacterium]